jgi:Spy/CpxP family protein refolding chaperone
MMKIFLVVLISVVLMLAVGGVVYAKKSGYCEGPDGRINWMVERVNKRLDLDEGQKTKLVELKDKMTSIRSEFRSSRQEGRQAVIELMSAAQLDQAKAQSLFEQFRDRTSEKSRVVIEAVAEFTDSLSQEQRTQLVDWINHRHDKRSGRHYGG